MNTPARAWCVASAAILLALALACGLSGCSLPGSTSGSASAPPHPSPAATALHPGPTANGHWVYTDAHTVETLRLQQGKDGSVSGDGSSAVTVGKGKVDHSTLDIRRASVHNGTLRLTLLITALDWNANLTLAENLHCTVAPRVLHCYTDIPLYKSYNIKQDFARRA